MRESEAPSPDVSVIIPTFNRLRFLPDAVQSALRQQGPFEIEVIVVDDGSTDASIEYLRTVAAAEPRLRYFSQPNRGPSAARNYGLRQARGIFVQFLDSDDLLLPDKIARHLAVMRDRPDVKLSHSIAVHLGPDGSQGDAVAQSDRPHPDLAKAVLTGSPFHTISPVYRRQACFDAGLWAENLHRFEDWEFNFRVALLPGSHVFIPERLSLVRSQAGSRLSCTSRKQLLADYIPYLTTLWRDFSDLAPGRSDLRYWIWRRTVVTAFWHLEARCPSGAENCLRIAGDMAPPFWYLPTVSARHLIAACECQPALSIMRAIMRCPRARRGL